MARTARSDTPPNTRAKLFTNGRSQAADDVAVSSVTVAELWYGAEKSDNPERKREAWATVLAPFQVVRALLLETRTYRGRVRLPREFRFEGKEVAIRKEGDAAILEPVGKRKWPSGYWQRIDRRAKDLDVGRVVPLGGHLLDLAADDV